MTIKQFIEKAIEGGWVFRSSIKVYRVTFDHPKYPHSVTLDSAEVIVSTLVHEILLDPLAWQAVGKVEGWGGRGDFWNEKGGRLVPGKPRVVGMLHAFCPEWQFHMHRMIDALAEGKTIEEFIATL